MESVNSKNEIRNSVTGFFKERNCVTLVRPVNKESLLRQFKDLNWEELRDSFKDACTKFINNVKTETKCKQIRGS
jgi:hypothetical protein